MLVVTEAAAMVIRGLIELSPNPADAGLRIAATSRPDGEAGMELTISEEPARGDVIVTVDDARIYLDTAMAPIFETKVLHAEETDGGVRFLIADQIGEDPASRNGSGPRVDPVG